MRCNSCREQLHNWFDSQGSAQMPPDVQEHVRDCSDCRAVIRSWNAVDLGMQSLKDHTSASLSSDFSLALRARLAHEEAGRRVRTPFLWFPALPRLQYARVAMAALAIIALVLAAKYTGAVYILFAHKPPVITASSGPAVPRTDDQKPAIPPDLPFANTGH